MPLNSRKKRGYTTRISDEIIIRLVSFAFEAGTLRKIARSHRQALLTDDLSDNIASHSFRVAIIGLLLASAENADTGKTVKMCLIHDLSETRSNDMNWVHKKYVKVFEDEITGAQFAGLHQEKEFMELSGEYSVRNTLEAKLAKDADLLDQLFILREYEWRGNKEASLWLKGKDNNNLFSETAKRMASELKKQRPSAWWSKIWTSKRR